MRAKSVSKKGNKRLHYLKITLITLGVIAAIAGDRLHPLSYNSYSNMCGFPSLLASLSKMITIIPLWILSRKVLFSINPAS